MKNAFVIGLILLSTVFCINSYGKSEQSIDQIIAIVNDDVVTKSELDHALDLTKMQMTQSNVATPPENVLQKQVLDQLVNKKLQLQIAKQAGVRVTDDDLNKAIERIATQNNISVSTLYQRIAQEGMQVSDYRDEIREQMTLQKLQHQEVVSHITVSPQEVNGFIRSNAWQDNRAKEYRLEDILVPLSETPSSNDVVNAKQRAQIVLNKLNKGESLRSILQAESSGGEALQTIDLGWRKLPEIPSAFVEHVTRLQPKEAAGPIQTSNGFHVLRLAEVKTLDARQATPDRKQVEGFLLQRKFEEAMQTWVSKLRGQAFIKVYPEKT